MRVIALKEHYATQRFLDGPWTQIQGWARVGGSALSGRRGRLLEQLGDIDDGRVSEMDAAGAVDV